MAGAGARTGEGSLEAPTRHPLDWKNPSFYDEDTLLAELERVFDICHGCRRCVNLCQSFPTLFDLVYMENELKDIFHRDVDLITRKGIESSHNYVRREAILSSAQVIYGLVKN